MFSSTKIMQALSPAGAAAGYQISRSLRFNSADSAYLNRTPASAGNRRKWTYSTWIKRTTLGDKKIFSGGTGTTDSTFLNFFFGSADNLRVSGYSTDWLITTQVFRDLSAFYHIMLVADTDNATSSDRLQLYVNGSRITAFSTASYPTGDLGVNNTQAHNIGRSTTGSNPLDAYCADTILVDGQALTPSSFGETDSATGVWVPKAYTGTYGTNGFWLKFDDNSGVTATTLGKDSSGNGNNWTPNNFSVTAGVGNDSLVDSPTNYGTDTGAGGEVRGNYATLNPLSRTTGTLVNGNLQFYGASAWKRCNGTISVSTGKWYWEVNIENAPSTPRSSTSNYNGFGFGLASTYDSSTAGGSVTDAIIYSDNGYVKNFSGANTDTGSAVANGDVLAVAVDLGANTYTFYKNNVSVATGTIGGTAGQELVPFILSYSNAFGLMSANFGQRPFAYTAPSGYKALCTTNLPTPAIGASASTLASKNFNIVTWTGANAAANVTVSGVGFQPDFVWSKSRSNAYSHPWYDAVRGVGKALFSNVTDAELTNDASGYISAFNSDGFTASVGATNNNYFNQLNVTYVAWNWKANGAGVSNTAGSITSTVSVNQTAGISIVTYTGTGANATVGHGLGAAPKMIIVKSRSQSGGYWRVYTAAMGATKVLYLNVTDAVATDALIWNNTAPTSTVFSIGTDTYTNNNGSTYVAYCFAEIAGFSKFGSYTGNGSADGPFVYCGFRPRFIMMKRTDAVADWEILDTARDTYNAATRLLQPNLSDAEATVGGPWYDILSNGFKVRTTNTFFNASGGTYIFMAFAESPFNYSRAR